MTKVMVTVPMYGSMCTAGFAISLANLMKKAVEWPSVHIEVLYALNESLIPKTRSMLAHAFLKSDADKLLFIDSDIAFDADQIFKMICTEEDVVCGIYPKKNIKWDRVAAAAMGGVSPEQLQTATAEYLFHPINDAKPDERGLVEIDRAGTGMMLISRRVFEGLSDKVSSFKLESGIQNVNDKDDRIKEFFFTATDPDSGIFLHEDFNFCKLWKETGGKIHAATWVRLQHVGMYTFG
jgi:hypothetical protein